MQSTSLTGIALGSNLGDRLAHMREARDRLLALRGASTPISASSIYETAPVDCAPGTPAYLNAVLEFGWNESVGVLLENLQQIEQEMGRPRPHPRNASRTIDLDILYCGDLLMETEEVTIPHPRLTQRRFVLQPLADLFPHRVLPGQTRTVRELLDDLPNREGVQSIGQTL